MNLRAALEILNAELGIDRLIIDDGGSTNGALLSAGLVDEVSLIVWPAIDGATGASCLFETTSPRGDATLVSAVTLLARERLEDDAIWPRSQSSWPDSQALGGR